MRVIDRGLIRNVLMLGVVALVSFAAGCEKVKTNAGSSSGQSASNDQDKFDPQVVIPYAFPAIVEPKSSSVEEADKELRPNELVLGVEVNGESRAYPINMLTGPEREIVNDVLGGKPIAATW